MQSRRWPGSLSAGSVVKDCDYNQRRSEKSSRSKMKVLFYNHTGEVGGAEHLLLLLLKNLDRVRFDATLVCPAGALQALAHEDEVRTETIDGLRLRFTWRVDLLFGYLKSFARVIRQLRQKVVQVDPDLVHANSIRAGLVATIATVGLRQNIVWHIHDLLPRHPFNLLIRAMASFSPRAAFVAVAHASAQRFAGKWNGLRKRVKVIPNAVDFEKFKQDRATRRRIRHELRVDNSSPLIGMIGRLTGAKGQLEMIKAFPRVLEQVPDASLLIVGAAAFNNEDEYLGELEQTIANLQSPDRVRLLGARNDVAEILQALDLLVVNSASEACSLVILEAMAAGTPVLATQTGGTPEIITHQQNGWLVPWQDPLALADSVVCLLGQPTVRAQLAATACDAVKAYSLERLITAVEAFYADVIADDDGVTPPKNSFARTIAR